MDSNQKKVGRETFLLQKESNGFEKINSITQKLVKFINGAFSNFGRKESQIFTK